MQEDGKIHIPARSKQPVDQQTVVKLSPEAYNVLVDIYNESALKLNENIDQDGFRKLEEYEQEELYTYHCSV